MFGRIGKGVCFQVEARAGMHDGCRQQLEHGVFTWIAFHLLPQRCSSAWHSNVTITGLIRGVGSFAGWLVW